METQKNNWTNNFYLQNLSYKQGNHIYLIKKYPHHWFMKNILTFQRIFFLFMKFYNFLAYLYGMFVCICMARGYKRANTKFNNGLVLSDLLYLQQYIFNRPCVAGAVHDGSRITGHWFINSLTDGFLKIFRWLQTRVYRPLNGAHILQGLLSKSSHSINKISKVNVTDNWKKLSYQLILNHKTKPKTKNKTELFIHYF